MTSFSWDAKIPDQKVRLRDNPGRQGVTTGKTMKTGSFLMVEVVFGPNEKQFKRYDDLEPVDSEEDLFSLLAQGRFGGPSDLRRILTLEKVKGDLTNLFYSMEASNTDFYSHQFKPVLKFIESPVGRLLIADEVGLGKTIEASYIWKELQARQNARRWIVICPSMLRQKWKDDLRNLFNINAEIVAAKAVLERLQEVDRNNPDDAFVLISSLEGLRPPNNFEDDKKQSTRAKLARLLDEKTATDDFALIDLVVFDEAHYLRNPSTANNRLARLLRDAARHLVLLTATPIQISSENLYQLLRLIDPDQFYDINLFSDILRANLPITQALRSLWRVPPDLSNIASSLNRAVLSPYFSNDMVLQRSLSDLKQIGLDPVKRIDLAKILESRSLLGQYMTRSRKREVLERKVERGAQTLNVTFNEVERSIYQRVSDNIRAKATGLTGFSLFPLIARQRQMASSLVAALESWDESGNLEDMIWEDIGQPLSKALSANGLDNDDDSETTLSTFDSSIQMTSPISAIDISKIEENDSKYKAVLALLKRELAKNQKEKFVLFAFFRGTLKYLRRRLESDGVKVALIMGGMGETKDEILERFESENGPSVLLSSEVGSEGIDLQFCRIVINYDLPWNPMRVEQRIGRLDRLGQKAERISIINLAVTDTIEDRILIRLYERIDVFRNSIGDLEEILGNQTEQLMLEILNPLLSDIERDRKAQEAAIAILGQRKEQERLEQEAVNLVGFSDYILDHIKESRTKGRWIGANELFALVEDFFALKFPGTKIKSTGVEAPVSFIQLSDDARATLGFFIAETKPATRTRLHQLPIPIQCHFDAKRSRGSKRDIEFIDPTHPLVQWIRSDYEQDPRQLHPVSAIRLSQKFTQVPQGAYAFVAHRWSFVALRSEHVLAFRAVCVDDWEPLDKFASEELVVAASRDGQLIENAANLLCNIESVLDGAKTCAELLFSGFEYQAEEFESDNRLRCDQQQISAERFADRKIQELNDRIYRFRAEGNARLVPMVQGLLHREQGLLNTKLARIESRRKTDITLRELVTGVIHVV